MFGNSTIQSKIIKFNGSSFGGLRGFGMIYSSLNSSSYYVMERQPSQVYILYDNWSYISYENFTDPAYMVTICNNLYMTGNSNLWK